MIVRKDKRNERDINEILRIADAKVGEPAPMTLKLVAYQEGHPRAEIAMIEPTEIGMRMRYVDALYSIDGIDAVS